MELLIQSKLIQYILQPLASLTNRIPTWLRNIAFVCAGSTIFLLHILYNAAILQPRYLFVWGWNSLMVGVMALCILPTELKPIPSDKRLMIPWFGYTLFIIISGLTNTSAYLMEALMFLLMFPVVYFVWNNGDGRRVLQLFTWICRLVFGGFFLVSALFFPVTEAQYVSCYNNTNGLAFFITALFCFLLINVLASRPKSILFWVDLVFLGFAWAFIYYSNSRTGQLAVLCATIFTFLLLLIREKKQFWKTTLFSHLVPIVLSIIVLQSGTLYVMKAPQWIKTTVSEMIESAQTVEPPVQSGDDVSTPSTDTPSTDAPSTDAPTPPPGPSIQEIQNSISEKQDAKTDLNRDADRISAGRISIWKGYLENIRFWGHAEGETFIYDREGVPAENGTAHMDILEIAYRYGILAGLLYLAFNLIAGVKSIFYALRHPEDRWAIAPFVVTIAYGVISALASVIWPYSYMITLSYFIVQFPLIPLTEKK